MRIVNHLDDVGCSPGSVMAWKALRKAGVIRSASVMVPCPYYPMARDDWQDAPDQDTGLHITLTAEWDNYRWRPLIGGSGGLTDDEGFFHRRPADVCAQADPMAVADEMEAQFDRLAQDGLRPTHIDAHMGTALLPPFGFALIELGKRHGVPVLACHDASVLWQAVGAARPDAGYVAEFLAEIKQARWPVFEEFVMGFCPEDRPIAEHVAGLLANLNEGLHYYAMHADTAEGYGRFAPHHEYPRREELRLFSDVQSAHLFEGFEIVEYRNLMQPHRQ